jgi:hypothetical protein
MNQLGSGDQRDSVLILLRDLPPIGRQVPKNTRQESKLNK